MIQYLWKKTSYFQLLSLLLYRSLSFVPEKISYKSIFTSPLRVSVAGDDYWNRPGPWDDPNLDTLLQANKKWSNRIKLTQPELFENIKKGHAPKILWIGCSDARVPANEIIGEPPGSVFVHRNIANQVVNTDFNCMSVIQYAVDVLQVKHIIVCGHYDCGGVRAALETVDHKSPLENWLRNIRDTHRLHKHEISAIPDLRQRQRRLVELNVIEQCLNIYKTAVVQRRRVATHLAKVNEPKIKFTEPRVHAFVYEPTTGEIQRLPVNFKPYMEDMQDIYAIYSTSTPQSPTVVISVDGASDKLYTKVAIESEQDIAPASAVRIGITHAPKNFRLPSFLRFWRNQ